MAYSIESESGFGELLRFRRNPPDYVAEAARRCVDIRCMRFGPRRIFQVNHPDLIRDVLVTHDWNFVKGPALRASRPISGRGLLTSEGELHRRQRSLVQPAFHSARLASYAQTMVACADAASRSWAPGAQVAIDQETMKLTLEIGASQGDRRAAQF